MQVPLEWDKVLYHTNPETNKRSLDWKNPPFPSPHPSLAFKGYVVEAQTNTIAAFFGKAGVKAKMGTRLPRPSGGVNKRFFDGLNACKNPLEREEYKRTHGKIYTPLSQRFGTEDPEI